MPDRRQRRMGTVCGCKRPDRHDRKPARLRDARGQTRILQPCAQPRGIGRHGKTAHLNRTPAARCRRCRLTRRGCARRDLRRRGTVEILVDEQRRAGDTAHERPPQRGIHQLPIGRACRAIRMPPRGISTRQTWTLRRRGPRRRGPARCRCRRRRLSSHRRSSNRGRGDRRRNNRRRRRLRLSHRVRGCKLRGRGVADRHPVRAIARDPCHLPAKGRAQKDAALTVGELAPFKSGRGQFGGATIALGMAQCGRGQKKPKRQRQMLHCNPR